MEIHPDMSSTEKHIVSVQNQVHELIDRYRHQMGELEAQAEDLDNAHQALGKQAEALKEATQAMENMQLLMAFNGDVAARQSLNKQLTVWMREINTCIAKLNA